MKLCIANWADNQSNAVPEERATVAELGLYVDPRSKYNAAAHVAEGESFQHLCVSVYGLAEGLAQDWWELMGNRVDWLPIRRYCNGYVLPDVRLLFDGQYIRLMTKELELTNPPVHFDACPESSWGRLQFEQAATDFIDKVLARLQAEGVASTSLELGWARVMESRREPDEVAFCEAAGALLLDPYCISAADTEFIFKAAREFKGEALLEFLSSIRTVDRARVSESLDLMPSLARDKTRLAELRAVCRRGGSSCSQAK